MSNKVLIGLAVGCGCLVVLIAVGGIVAAILIPNLADAMEKAKQKRTVSDVRNVGTAWMSWLTDQVGESETWDIGEHPTAAEMEAILVPEYMQDLPTTDGWGHELRYTVLSTKFTDASILRISSPGRDGVFEDPPPKGNRPFPAIEYDYDVVWQDGYFVSYPETSSR